MGSLASARDVRVLMVDDHPENLLALEAVLEPLGHELVRASSADEAFRHLLHKDFAVILMDVQMPGMDGFSAASLIKQRERTRTIPIIFITALSRDASFVFEGYEHGAVDYILKPIEPTILRSKVSVFAELHRQRLEIEQQAQQLLEERERRSARRYRALSDSLPISVWVTDRVGMATYRNKQVRERHAIEPSAPFDWVSAMHAEDRQRVREAWRHAVEQREPKELEVRLHEQGHWHLVSIVPDSDVDGGCIIAATDISGQKDAQDAAEHANRLKDEFLATVSHELRTPLNAILGWTQNLLDTNPDTTIYRGLKAVERNARSQAELIDDILDVSRIVTGKLQLTLEPRALRPIIEAAMDVVRPASDAKGVSLSVGELADADVMGDAARLQQIVWNLLSNAVKFTPKGGAVTVSSVVQGTDIDLVITDSGDGIEPAFLPYVFDRFRQADSSSTRRHGGLGLGLAIVKNLAELQGGTVRAESEGLGHGARFVVRLPVRQGGVRSEPRRETPRGVRPVSSKLSGKKVLIVDDDADARMLMEMLFMRKGAEVATAGSVPQAFECLEGFVPALVVSDIGMPGEDGYSLIARLRRLPPDRGGATPAIALTGFASDGDQAHVLESGFQGYLSKPVESAALLALVEELL